MPAVVYKVNPKFTSALAGSTLGALSRSESERNTVPDSGSAPNDATWLLAYASPNVSAIPMTSPVERISGPRTESTPIPSVLRNLFQGSTASFTDTPTGIPSPALGKKFASLSSAMLFPIAMSEAALAN